MSIHKSIEPTKEFFIGRDTEWEQVAPGLSRQIMGFDEHIMLVKAKFDKDAVGQLHKHYHSQVTYVDSGKFEMSIGDEKRILEEGDSFYIPKEVMHGCICLEPGILIDVFSPAREDFLGYEMLEKDPR